MAAFEVDLTREPQISESAKRAGTSPVNAVVRETIMERQLN